MSSELWEEVILRDAQRMWVESGMEMAGLSFREWLNLHPVICVVGFLSPPGSVKCFGRQTVDHVKDQMEIGAPIVKQRTIRAPSDPRHLVACCWGHNVHAPPNKEMRHKERIWLKTV